MNRLQYENVQATAYALYEVSQGLFWQCLPVAFLLAILMIFASGEISGARFESLFRRLLVAIALLIAFPQISDAAHGLEASLMQAFGGEQSLTDMFSRVGDRAKEIKDSGTFSWIQLGQAGLTVISTISFLVLSIVQHFLKILQIITWNLLHILGPLALLGCLFPSWSNVPRGIFVGMLELVLWKPVWIILAKLLLAIGFGEAPTDPEAWFDTAIMNFAVAGLMASTPALVHGFLSGTLASVGGSTVQSMVSGAGAALAAAPMRTITNVASATTQATKKGASFVGQKTLRAARQAFMRPLKKAPSPKPILRK